MVANVIGDIITGDIAEPEVIVSSGTSVGGLLDSLTGSIGISARPKPIAASVAAPVAQLHQFPRLLVLLNQTLSKVVYDLLTRIYYGTSSLVLCLLVSN